MCQKQGGFGPSNRGIFAVTAAVNVIWCNPVTKTVGTKLDCFHDAVEGDPNAPTTSYL